ncbi:hypothetical protein K502DRAFT_367794, partial [Neoconidiobolus thromboides FSU 785]
MNAALSKRRVLDIKTKKNIIEKSELGLSHQKIADMYNIGRSTVTKIIQRKQYILSSTIAEYRSSRKRIRKTEHDLLEKKLLELCFDFNDGRSLIKPGVDAEKIIAKANELAVEFGYWNFVGDLTWAGRFRRKYNLNFKISKKKLNNNPVVTSNVTPDITNNQSQASSSFDSKSYDPTLIGYNNNNLFDAAYFNFPSIEPSFSSSPLLYSQHSPSFEHNFMFDQYCQEIYYPLPHYYN